MKWLDSIKRKSWFIRLTNWEYWPSLAFYWPMFLAGPLLALRSRHPVFFSAANPGIQAGGFGLESKYQTILKIPAEWRPKSILAEPGADPVWLRRQLAGAGITYPLIAKPDLGFRGLLVRRIFSETELFDYLGRYQAPFLLQEFLDYPEEIGVLYYRFPDQSRGRVSSLTFKAFLHVVGDGRSSLRQLIEGNARASLQLERLEAELGSALDDIPEPGRRIPLGVVGNHSKGTQFINANHLIDSRLEETFDRIAARIEGFNYGRFDIKCRSFEDLRDGRHFKIIELNGVCSEPTHIYDPEQMNYFQALGAILRHWRLIRRIAAGNHSLGVPYLATKTMLSELARMRDYLKGLGT